MKLLYKIFTAAAVGLAALSCTGEDLRPDGEGLGSNDPALTNTDFRGCIDAVNKAWNLGEKVMVYDNVSASGNEYVVSQVTADGNCIMKGKVFNTAELYYALYPASAFNGLVSGNAEVIIPALQKLPHQDSTKAATASAAVAMTHMKEFDFVSVASYVAVEIATDKVKSVTVRSNDDFAPSGTMTLSVADGSIISSTGDKAVTLLPAGTSFLPGTYYIQVKPGEYPAGLALDVEIENDEEMIIDVALPSEVQVGKTYNAGSIRSPFRAVEVSEVAFSSARLHWKSNAKAVNYNVYVNGVKKETLPATTFDYALTGLLTGTDNQVAVEAVTASGVTASVELNVRTKGVYEYEKSTGTSFLCIGWDAPVRQEMHGYTQAYQIQVWADEAMTHKVYDFVPEGGGNNGQDQIFGNGSYYGKTMLPQGPDDLMCENYLTPTRVSVGGFYPGTTYYVRVRTLASFVQANGVELSHPWGDSAWSDLIPMTTDSEHVPAANEVIYGGFNDMCVQTDFLNSCLGAKNATSNSAIAWDKRPAQLFYFYVNNHGQHQSNTYGLSSNGTKIDGKTSCLTGNAAGVGNTYVGDMAGWDWTVVTKPVMGAYLLEGNGSFVGTPALTSDKLAAEGTDCSLNFKAGLRVRMSDSYTATADALAVQVWRAATSTYETIKTFKTSEILPFDLAKDTPTEVLYDYGRNTLKCEMKLHPGDNVELVTMISGYIIVDDILVVKK